jgi:hypothetical protein
MGLFALPLLMTGEKVGDIGIGSGVGQWAPQEVNGSGTWRGQAGVIAARPDGCLRHGRRRTMYQPLSHGEGVGRCDWLRVRVVSTFART